jgi:hypothetical protein
MTTTGQYISEAIDSARFAGIFADCLRMDHPVECDPQDAAARDKAEKLLLHARALNCAAQQIANDYAGIPRPKEG